MRCGVLHRCFVGWSLAAVLYGGATAFASDAAPGRTEAPTSIPHIALMLPGGSSAFARAAEAVKLGFLTAGRTRDPTRLPIRIYPAADDPQQLVAGYSQALTAGARLVVGPLTRNGVTALIESRRIAVPTLALNVPERPIAMPANLYTLSLHVEAEARQVAQLAFRDGRHKAFTINGDTPLLRRIHQAFVEEFVRLGGEHVAAYSFTADPAGLARIKQAVGLRVADMVFLALDFSRARIARPYLDPLSLYATSQVHPGNAGPLAGFDLASIRFLDMPWLLQPDHPAVMVYPRQNFQGALDLERLYALGIDAFRLAQALLEDKSDAPLDGVTGRLSLGHDRQFVRDLTVAQFSDGKLLTSAGQR